MQKQIKTWKHLMVLFLLTVMCAASVSAQQQPTVTVNLTNVTLKTFFKNIEGQTTYRFSYKSDIVDNQKDVTVNFKDTPVTDVLSTVLAKRDLVYQIVSDKSIVILKKGQKAPRNSVKTVTGTVRDVNGEPLMGATILVEGTSRGTATNYDGQFSIDASSSETLVFSYLGFGKQYVRVGNSTNLNIRMTENENVMDEVVVVGYGKQRRRNIVGAVENLSGKELENRPNAYLIRSLQGMVPGLNITMTDGKPSRSASMQIRATTQSIGAGGSALCLVDGVEADLTAINPDDVESISVLKDASSTAVYGARGAFGVILVTTKKASAGKVSVNYSGSVSVISETVRPTYETNSLIWYNGAMEAFKGVCGNNSRLPSGINNMFAWSQSWENEFLKRMNDPDQGYTDWSIGSDGKYQYYGNGTNWYDLFYKKHTTAQQHNVRISGSGPRASYNVSARYYQQDGMYRVGNEMFKQFNVRAKGAVNITDNITLENNVDFVRRTYHEPTTYNQSLLAKRNIEHQGYPLTLVTNPDGTWTAAAAAIGYANMAEGNSYRDNNKFDMKNSTFLTYNIIKDVLVARADYSYWYNHTHRDNVIAQVTYSTAPGVEITTPSTSYLNTYEWHNEYHNGNVNLTFSPKLNRDNHLDVVAGWNIEHYRARYTFMQRDGLILSDKPNYSLMTGVNYTLRDASSYDWGFVGLFYRANYAYKGKYLAELSGRYDGSSKFPTNERWGFFPSASVGWRMSQESFMRNFTALDNLKWRFSIGKAGNGNVSAYKYMELMTFSKSSIIINGSQQTYTNVPSSLIPKNITWEEASTINLGLDINMLNNRLSFVGDIYRKATNNMFVVGAELPAVTGYSAPYGNNADMVTKGIELSLGWQDHFHLANKPFSYNIRLSMWDSKSKITKYTSKTNTLPTVYSPNNYYEGMELGEIWGYHVLGLFQSDEEAQEYGTTYQKTTFWSGDGADWRAGDLKFADLNGDGVVNNGSNTRDNHGDLVKIGNTSPRYNYGINLGANWNNFGLSVFFQGVGKRDWYPAAESGLFWGQYNRYYGYALPWQNADRWSEDNPNAYWPRLRGSLSISTRGTLRAANDRYLQNAAYCRLKNVTFDYSLPKKVLRKTPIESLKVYVTGENLFFWSPLKKYAKNYDPEAITAGDSDYTSTLGTDGQGYGYPQTKSVTFGLNISF
jgi:TonB-linked SusC/RagA family outer membrane protein